MDKRNLKLLSVERSMVFFLLDNIGYLKIINTSFEMSIDRNFFEYFLKNKEFQG